MSQFRDSLATDVMVAVDYTHPFWENDDHSVLDKNVADAILRSPEMQQIRSALKRMAETATLPLDERSPGSVSYLRRMGLPQHVIDWVLG